MTSIVDTSVKHAYSSMVGAPTINGTAGSLIGALRAFLVTGWGAKAVDSATISNGVCRLNFASGKSAAEAHVVIVVAGASQAALNGEQRVTAVGGNFVEFKTDLPDGAVTGTINFKMAPLGFDEPFAGTATSAVFRSANVAGTRMYLRVDDAGTTNARVRAYESMSDVNNGVAAIPLESQVSGGLYWPKSGAANAVPRPWYMFGDSRGFYVALDPQSGGRFSLSYAGDIASFKSGDAWAYLMTGNQSDQVGVGSTPEACCGASFRSARNGAYLARLHTGIGGAVPAQRIGSHHTGTLADAYAGVANYAWGAYPNGANNGLMTGLVEIYAQSMRGTLPGLLHPVQDLSSNFATGAIVDGTDDYLGRKLMALRVGVPTGASFGTVFLDTNGPWSR